MFDILKMDSREVFALVVVFLLAFGIGGYPARATLPDFYLPLKMQEAALPPGQIAGCGEAGCTVVFSEAEYFVHSAANAYALAIGASPGSPSTIVSFMLLFPPLLFAITALFSYLALRVHGFRKTVAAAAALLFIFSTTAYLSFLPGSFGAAATAAPFFALFFLASSWHYKKNSLVALAIGSVFGTYSAILYPVFALAGVAAVASFAYSARRRSEKIALFAIPLALFAGVLLLPSFSALPQAGVENARNFLIQSSPLIAASAAAAALFVFSECSIEALLLAASAAALSFFSPLASALLLAVPSAEGIARLSDEAGKKGAKLAALFAFTFFLFLGPLYAGYGSLLRAAAGSMLISAIAPLVMHFYEYKARRIMPLAVLFAVSAAVFLALFSQSMPHYGAPAYADPKISAALADLSSSGIDSLYLLGSADEARLRMPGAEINNESLAAFLMDGSGRPKSGSAALVPLSCLDRPPDCGLGGSGEGQPFESFRYFSNASDGQGGSYVFFASEGLVLMRAVDSAGQFSLNDGRLIDSSGRAYATVPLSRMVLLRHDKPYWSPQNRIIVLSEEAPPPFFITLYSGTLNSVRLKEDFGQVALFEVE